MDDGIINGKYYVERADGKPRPRARYFVLDYASDPFAREAMRAYADACEATYPKLASSIRIVVERHDAQAMELARGTDRPVRGTQGAGAVPASEDELVALVAARALTDPGFARRLQEGVADALPSVAAAEGE